MAIKVILKESNNTVTLSSNLSNGTVFKGEINGVLGLFRKYSLLIDTFGNRRSYVISLENDSKMYWDCELTIVNYKEVNIEIKEV